MVAGMKWQELLLLGLVGWTLLGIVGMTISAVRTRLGFEGERERVRNGVIAIVGVWFLYMAVLLGVSLGQRQKVVAMGQEQCFDDMCFAVTGVEEVQRFLGANGIGDGSRLVRVKVVVRNKGRGKTQAEKAIEAYLVDGQGRRWEESRGVNGNRLTDRVVAGQKIVCEPVFKVAADASELGLVLTHGLWQPGRLVIGDSDSLLHKRTVVALGR
jgi:hypothetical protein